MKNKASTALHPYIMAVVLKLGIYFMQVVAKCLHFVMSCMKQNNKRKQTLECAHYGMEIIFKAPFTTETGRLFFRRHTKQLLLSRNVFESSPRGL